MALTQMDAEALKNDPTLRIVHTGGAGNSSFAVTKAQQDNIDSISLGGNVCLGGGKNMVPINLQI